MARSNPEEKEKYKKAAENLKKIFPDNGKTLCKKRLDELLKEVKKDPLEKIHCEFEEKYFGSDGYSIKGIDFLNIKGMQQIPKPESESDPCYKILYAMAWKNGDLGKEKIARLAIATKCKRPQFMRTK